jgi:hypothetical protein
MKKNHRALSRRSLRRAASRAERRKTRMNIRSLSPKPVPWDAFADNCQFYLAPEKYAEQSVAGAVDPLSTLDDGFRAQAGWHKLSDSDPTRALNVSVGMRRPAREFVTGSGHRFVAIDPHTYKGDGVRGQVAHKAFWDHQMNGRPASMPFLKSGPAIWKKLNIADPPEAVAYMMQMKSVDAETSEAIQASIWSAFNTASYPMDIETAAFLLATFMHTDPLRKHLVSDEQFVEPYGDRTQYALREVYKLTTDEVVGDDDDVPDGRRPAPRYLPIEADDARRQQIAADPTIDPEHLDTLDGLKLLLTSEAEKTRVFCGTLDPELQIILESLLDVAIREIEVEHATVVGIVNVLILRMLDTCAELRRHPMAPLPHLT